MKEIIIEALQPLLDSFQEQALDKLTNKAKEIFKNLIDGLKSSDKIVNINIECLDKKKLVEIASKYKIEGCSEVVAYKVPTEDAYTIYLTYSFNRELLEQGINTYVIVRCNYIARDIETLFAKDKLILLT